jgi:ribosomal protein S18 acetylase RimI-like enzyme
MRFERVSDSGSPAFGEIWTIYESSFPEDERRTLDQQKALFSNPRYFLLAAYSENARSAGFISCWLVDGFHFIEHMAIHEPGRRKGAGTRMLRAFMEGKARIILECENPQGAEQKRRIAFYKKAGFHANDFDYIQPPYGIDKNPVHLLLMSYPEKLGAVEFHNVRNAIHRMVYGLNEPLI